MGITIHFQGTLKDPLLINSIMDELIDIAETMEWKRHSLDEDWSKPVTAGLSFSDNKVEISGHLALKGVQLSLHPNCEPLQIYFNKDGKLITPTSVALLNEGKIKPEEIYCSVKTQFAPADVHISIIKLLRYLKKQYIPNLYVIDEGNYWNTENKETLINKMDFIKEKMDVIENILLSVDEESIRRYSPEQLADLLENKLRKHLNK